MKVKAKIIKVLTGYRPVIYVGGRWRSFATPHSPKDCEFKPHRAKEKARTAANKVAAELGIKLTWEVTT